MKTAMLATALLATSSGLSVESQQLTVPMGSYVSMELNGSTVRVYYDSLVTYEFFTEDGSSRQLETCRVDIQEEGWFPILFEFDIRTERKSFLGFELRCTPTAVTFIPPPA